MNEDDLPDDYIAQKGLKFLFRNVGLEEYRDWDVIPNVREFERPQKSYDEEDITNSDSPDQSKETFQTTKSFSDFTMKVLYSQRLWDRLSALDDVKSPTEIMIVNTLEMRVVRFNVWPQVDESNVEWNGRRMFDFTGKRTGAEVREKITALPAIIADDAAPEALPPIELPEEPAEGGA